MNASPEQIQIVRTVITEFLPVTDNLACAEIVLGISLKYVVGNTNKATTRCEVRNALSKINKQADDEILNLCIDTAHALAWGYRHWKQSQENVDVLDIYPALQLLDRYHHVEAVDWFQKWQDNGGQISAKKEMIALKNDPIWTRISAFHLPFPPFDLESGMDVSEIHRHEAEELGLLAASKQVEPTIIDLDFGAALRQRLAEYFSPEVQKQKLKIAMQHANANGLLKLARERLDSLEEITSESAPEIVTILECALERGFGENLREQTEACGFLVEAYDLLGQTDKATIYQRGQLDSQLAWIEKGIPFDFNQRADAYGLVASIYEDLDQPDQAIAYRQLQMENRDGFTLLIEALAELKACNGSLNKEVGARILDNLTKAAVRIPQKYPERHAEIFRATGEILETWGDTTQAIEYYEFAIQKNPKVGVKRRLDNLRKSANLPTVDADQQENS